MTEHHNGDVMVYAVGDTSFTRCMKMIQDWTWQDNPEFHKELMRCNVANIKVLAKSKQYYRRLYGQQ